MCRIGGEWNVGAYHASRMMSALGSMCWSARTTACRETDDRLPHISRSALGTPRKSPREGSRLLYRRPGSSRRAALAIPPEPRADSPENEYDQTRTLPCHREGTKTPSVQPIADEWGVSFLGVTCGADQAVEKFRRMAPAVISSWDALHTAAPCRKMMTCGDSCRTPVRAAIC